MTVNKTFITVEAIILAPVEIVWQYWTSVEHIINWNRASEDWHTTFAENDLNEGGNFLYRMSAKDEKFSFDLMGVYDRVKEYELLEYTLSDARKVKIEFTSMDEYTKLVECFEVELVSSVDLQKNGWQSILNNFKKYVEEN